MNRSLQTLLCFALLVPSLTHSASANPQEGEAQGGASAESAPESPADAPARDQAGSEVEAYRSRLLDYAYRSVSCLPAYQFIKERSASQELVVQASLALGDAATAMKYVEGIENWRSGLCHGHLAVHFAEQGKESEARSHIAAANEVAEWGEDRLKQAWRRDRILAQIARAHFLLGDSGQGEAIDANLVESEAGKARVAQAERATEESLEQMLESLQQATVGRELDRVTNALKAYTALFQRFFEETETREELEELIRKGMTKMPILVRLEALEGMANAALAVSGVRWDFDAMAVTPPVTGRMRSAVRAASGGTSAPGTALACQAEATLSATNRRFSAGA